jgi:hypothetical protein
MRTVMNCVVSSLFNILFRLRIYELSQVKYLLMLCASSALPALANHNAASSSIIHQAGRNLFEKLHAVEVKSIAQFLDQKDINHLVASSRRCNADVRGENLTTFTEGRVDTLKLDTPEKLNEFLTRKQIICTQEFNLRSQSTMRKSLDDCSVIRNFTDL